MIRTTTLLPLSIVPLADGRVPVGLLSLTLTKQTCVNNVGSLRGVVISRIYLFGVPLSGTLTR